MALRRAADDSRPLAELQGVSLRRSGLQILAGIDWTILRGERWVILGPNGAGKTSLVRILSTYATASEGSVTVLGELIGRTNVQELRTRIGYLSPSLAAMVPDHLTPHEIVTAGQLGAVLPWYLDRSGLSPPRTRDALALVGLGDLPDRPYSAFSSGEQLRIQLARALVNRPRVLLLDEPMANLDIGAREALIASLARVAARAVGAIVIVVHRVEDIPPGFTDALLLREGRIVGCGRLDDVLTDEAMSACFGLPLELRRGGQRFSVAPRDARVGEAPVDRDWR